MLFFIYTTIHFTQMRGTSMLWESNFIHELEKVNGEHETWSRLQSFITRVLNKINEFCSWTTKTSFYCNKLVTSSPLWVDFIHHLCLWWWTFFRRVNLAVIHVFITYCDRDFNLISFKTCHFLHLSNILTTSLVQPHKSFVMKDIFLFITLFPN